jgi:hypothetical protein
VSMAIVPMKPFLPEFATGKRENFTGRAIAMAENTGVQVAAAKAVTAAKLGNSTPRNVPVPMAVAGATDATLEVRDVNGDGLKDAVISDKKSGETATLLNRGDEQKTQLDNEAIDLTQPTHVDLDRLAVEGEETGREFLAVDFDGDGVRQLAVKEGDTFLSLGTTDAAGEQAVEEAEQRYLQLIGQLSVRPAAFALDARANDRRFVGHVQMLDGTVNQDWLRGLDFNVDNLGGLTMMDLTGNQVSAFGVTSPGIDIYLSEQPAAPASSPGPTTAPVKKA